MIDGGVVKAFLVAAVGVALIVAVWVSVEDLSATVSGDSYCEVDGRRVTSVWAVKDDTQQLLSMDPDHACTLNQLAPDTTYDYVLPGKVQLTVNGTGEIEGGVPHEAPGLMESPVMTGYAAAGVELLAGLASVSFFAIVLLVWKE